MKERLRSIELAPELVEAYAQTFIPRWDCYPLQLEDGSYAQIRQPLTLTHVFRHLTAYHAGMKPLTLGAYALDQDSHARWLCLDADTPEQWQHIHTLANSLWLQDIPNYMELSRRGGHLWLFTPPLSGTLIRQFARQLLAQHKISERDSSGKKTLEIYPKQDVLQDGPGSLVRLPLGVHLKAKQVYPFIEADEQLLASTVRAQIAALATPRRVPLDFVQEVLSTVVELPTPPPTSTVSFEKRRPRRGESLSETLKHTISVADFVSGYIELDAHNRGFCPFHDDQKKSFQVNVAHNYWHCYADCGSGSLIDFWMLWRETHGQDGSFTETIRELREMLL